jgi:glutamyl-tRNA(Gln) amidotransferase subunit E
MLQLRDDTPDLSAVGLSAIGLKIGLEIHQQLGGPRTRNRKLFCNCPADIVERDADLIVERKLRASAGESGTTDAAATAEQAKGKRFCYHAYRDTTCLVELDEEPPHPVDPDAITTAIMAAKACGSIIMPRVQFMRKTIIDGSAVSGFQRTGLLALGGNVPDVVPTVRVQTVCVEEDAAKIIERTADADAYNLSRLGIPLIELATEPDIVSPQHAQDTAAAIGMLLRSTRRVKRGLGTIRQDLNVSIAGGNRIEIKGCQDLRLIPTYAEYEATRQHRLLRLRDCIIARAGADTLRREHEVSPFVSTDIIDVTDAFLAVKKGFIASAIASGSRVLGVRIPYLNALLGQELCPGYRVGSELADHARAAGFGGLIHSDEDFAKYGLTIEAKVALRAMFACGNYDGFAVVVGDSERARRLFIDAINPRIDKFARHVPKEVRKANPDGTTGYLRMMPGAARMYPETDIPLVDIKTGGIEAPMLFTQQAKQLSETTGISEDQAREIVRDDLPFDEWRERFPGIDATFLATAMLTYGKEIEARYKKTIYHFELLPTLFEAVEAKRIERSAVFEILVAIAEGKTTIRTIDFAKYQTISTHDLERIVKDAIASATPGTTPNGIMGVVMAKARGKADGKQVMALIQQHMPQQSQNR